MFRNRRCAFACYLFGRLNWQLERYGKAGPTRSALITVVVGRKVTEKCTELFGSAVTVTLAGGPMEIH